MSYLPIKISNRVSLEMLDGGGSWMAPPFYNFIKGIKPGFGSVVVNTFAECARRFPPNHTIEACCDRLVKFFENPAAPFNKVYESAFEWCAGPGFIGLYLLQMGVCKKLCLADINPAAIESIKSTVRDNGLEERVSYYLSNNFDSIPEHEKFDLVVSNPPNYFSLHPHHPDYLRLKHDLRPNDPGWKIHLRFYNSVVPHLLKGATLLIEEVEPFSKDVFIPACSKIPYDCRGHLPIDEFKKMLVSAGLKFHSCEKFFTAPSDGVNFYMFASIYEG